MAIEYELTDSMCLTIKVGIIKRAQCTYFWSPGRDVDNVTISRTCRRMSLCGVSGSWHGPMLRHSDVSQVWGEMSGHFYTLSSADQGCLKRRSELVQAQNWGFILKTIHSIPFVAFFNSIISGTQFGAGLPRSAHAQSDVWQPCQTGPGHAQNEGALCQTESQILCYWKRNKRNGVTCLPIPP